MSDKTVAKQVSIIRVLTLWVTTVLLVSVTFVTAIWLYLDYRRSREDFLSISQSTIESYQRYVKQAVDEAVNYADTMRARTSERARENVRTRVEDGIATAAAIDTALRGFANLRAREDAVREALRPLRFFDGEGYFFAVSLDGTEQLYPLHPELEGENLFDLRDAKGAFAIRDEIEMVTRQGGGFLQHYWAKPDGTVAEKVSYVRHFEPFDWYIGTGIYLDTVEGQIKEEVLARLADMELVEDAYVFAGRYDGMSLLGPNTGENMLDYVDENGVPVVRELIRLAREGGGFLTYTPPDSTGYPNTAKVSYVRGVDDWEWYVGAGVQVEDIQAQVDSRQQELASDIRTKMIFLGGVYLLVISLALLIGSMITRRIRRSISIFTDFFSRAATSHEKIVLSQLPFEETVTLGSHANYMVDEYLENQAALISKETELQRSRQADSLGGLAAAIAHDFNNLLTVILGNISLVRSVQGEDSETDEQLADAETAAQKARDLSVQMLTFSKGGAPETRTTNLVPLVRKGVEFGLKGTNVTAQFDIAHDIAPVDLDEKQFSQVISNLMVNACQAMPDGGIVTISARNGTGRLPGDITERQIVRLTVTDDGPGIWPEDAHRIFDPYFTTKDIGTGLGLATVHSIVVKHGGTIMANPDHAGGAQFIICLPASAHQPEDPDAKTTASEVDAAEMDGRVLVMDDEEQVRTIASRMLAEIGFEVTATANGDDAIEEYRRARQQKRPFSFVVLDLTVHDGMGGLECARELRRIDPGVRAVVSSGYSEDAVMANPHDHGFIAALRKPFRFDDLRRVFRSLLDEQSNAQLSSRSPGDVG